MDEGMCPDQLQQRADSDPQFTISTSRGDLRNAVYRLRQDLITIEEMLGCDGVGGYTELHRIVVSHLTQALSELKKGGE